MKRSTWLIAAMVATATQAIEPAQADSLVVKAQRAYAHGDHQQALSLFDSVATEYNSAGLQLNIGNCYFKTGDVARAILHYERGLKLAPGDADLRANLDLANEQVKDRLAGKPTLALGNTWATVRGGHDPDQWARRSLWASALFFALLAISLIAQHRALKRTLWALSAASLSFLLVCVAFASYRHRELTDDSAAIIVSPKVDVLGEPRSGSTVLFVLHKGTKVSVLQTTDGWYEVELPNGSIGWMPPATLERI